MSHTPLESSIQKTTIHKLQERGVLVRKKHGSAFGRKGEPDLYGCHHGRCFVIELKRPGEQPTALQYRRLQEWADAGAIAGWAVSADGALALLGLSDTQCGFASIPGATRA